MIRKWLWRILKVTIWTMIVLASFKIGTYLQFRHDQGSDASCGAPTWYKDYKQFWDRKNAAIIRDHGLKRI